MLTEKEIDDLFYDLGVERYEREVHHERILIELIFKLNEKVNHLDDFSDDTY